MPNDDAGPLTPGEELQRTRVKRAGFVPTGSMKARSYASWGIELTKGRVGCIAVSSRGADPAFGHVGFLLGETSDKVILLGSKQRDAVSVAAFDKDRLIALRWPRQDVEWADTSPRSNAGSGFDVALAHVQERRYTDRVGRPTRASLLGLRGLGACLGRCDVAQNARQ